MIKNWLFPAFVAVFLCGCEKEEIPKSMSGNHTGLSKSALAKVESYNGIPHRLDNCINDGTMWRADVNPSALTGSFVECLIPLDDEHYVEGALIPNYYKWAYDRYVESEPDFKRLIAAHLLEVATSRGLSIEVSHEPTPDDILRQFRLSTIFLHEPGKDVLGHAELSFYLGEGFTDGFEVIVSLDPPGVYVGDTLYSHQESK